MHRGRGRRGRRDAPYHPHPRRRSHGHGPPRLAHQAFDLWQAEEFFPRAGPSPDNDALTKALIARHTQLLPRPSQQTQVTDLVTKVTAIMDNLIVLQTGHEEHAIEELRPVGNHKQGTAMVNDQCAELVVLFKVWPTVKCIEKLSELIVENLREMEVPSGSITMTNDKAGFTIQVETCQVRCHASTLPESWLEPTLPGQVEVRDIENGLAYIRHTRWFEENVTQTGTRMLIRLLSDIGSRITGFKHLTPWMLVLLAHQASLAPGRRDTLPIAQAFRRAMHLLSAGFFLPSSEGITDPCEASAYRIHHALGFEKQELLCCAAQTAMRLLSHGAHSEILGMNQDCSVDFEATMNCGGVIISPAVCVYQQEDENAERKNGDKKDTNGQSEEQATAVEKSQA